MGTGTEQFLSCRCLLRLFWLGSRGFTRSLSSGVRLLVPTVHDSGYSDVPMPRKNKSLRKPYPTPMEVLIRRARLEKEIRKSQPCRMLPHPPDNGLLVPDLVPIAHQVYRAHYDLIAGLKKLVQVVPVHRCRFCAEVHIDRVGHDIRTCDGAGSGTRCATHVWRTGGVRSVVFFPQCFHLYDRVGSPVIGHDERSLVPRIPAIVELCSQAGVDLDMFPTKRRSKPVFSIEGRIVDYEEIVGKNEVNGYLDEKDCDSLNKSKDHYPTSASSMERDDNAVISSAGLNDSQSEIEVTDTKALSIKTMEAWLQMVTGAKEIMRKYTVWTCGYCSEVQVGPKGHRVRMCKARKHQARDGQHAWQEATTDDLIGPNYVWHVRNLTGHPLDNNLKRFCGKAPALVELCIQAGAPVPEQFKSMMRLDVVIPDRDEVDLVA